MLLDIMVVSPMKTHGGNAECQPVDQQEFEFGIDVELLIQRTAWSLGREIIKVHSASTMTRRIRAK
jgi:hypothetical protein